MSISIRESREAGNPPRIATKFYYTHKYYTVKLKQQRAEEGFLLRVLTGDAGHLTISASISIDNPAENFEYLFPCESRYSETEKTEQSEIEMSASRFRVHAYSDEEEYRRTDGRER
jgi:hypothetical protein